MAQTVKLKRSAVAAKVPLTSDLALGELAVNTNDGVLYTLMNDGTNKIVQLGGQSVTATVTAGTNAQGQGPLTSNVNVVTTTTANPSGITLPTALLGRKVYVFNRGTNPINVYPASGAQIDSVGTNTSVQIPVNGGVEFNASSTTQWYSSLSSTLISPSITSAVLSGTLTAGGSAGTSGQILSSTGTGVQWINNTGVSLSADNAFTGANTFTNATGQTFRQAATQDGIIVTGRAGGTGSFDVILTPATLSADQTLTLPNVTGTVVTTGDTGSVTSAMIATETIANTDVSLTAAIAGTKIAPDFGAQLIQSSQANQALSLTGTLNPSATSNGLLSVGTLGFTGARMGGNFTSSQTSYYQVILQNTSSNAGASTDFVVCNNASTDTAVYGNFGINSSTFTGTSSLNLPSATYLSATTGELSIGTTSANGIHFVINGAATDAFGINTSGAWLIAGSAGTAGQLFRSGGSAAAPTWTDIGAVEIDTMTSTQQSTTTALANVTQLVGALAANATYEVDCFVTFQSAGTTTGLNLGFTSPTGCRPMVEVVVPIASTAVASALRTTFPNAAATTSGNVLGTGVTAINSNHTARISGIIVNGGTAGNFQIQFATETNATAVTLQIGSMMKLTRIA
jgi:hypothetical protein